MSEITERLTAALASRYRIERELGTGGMATVYLAHDEKHDRKVALKVLKPELAAVIGAERFLNEIKVTANLQHSHITPLFDSGEADSFLYYVMPYVEGESLRDKLDRQKQLGVEEAVEVTKAVASALDYAHRHDVVHRDIKPANIMLQDGDPLVMDFGIALAVTQAGGARITETGLSLGTPYYMSPEQATGDRDVDGRSDIYSLGCVLYESLAGDPPHTGSTVQAVIAKVVTETPRLISQVRNTVPVQVAAALQKALAKVPADRFATAGEFADALSGRLPLALDLPSAAQPGARPAGRFAMDWRVAVPGALLLLAAGAGLWELARPSAQPSALPIRFAFAPPAEKAFQQVTGPILALSPDGSRLVYVGRSGGRWGRQLYLRRLDDLEPTPIPGTEGGATPFFSPDSRWLGFLADGKLQKVPIDGGPAFTIADAPGDVRGASWGDGDVVVFAAAGGGGLSRVSAAGGDPVVLTTPDTASGVAAHRWPHMLPGGVTAVFTVWFGTRETAKLAAVSLETGEVIPLLDGGMGGQYDESGYLLFGRADGSLAAVPFDPEAVAVTGQAVAIHQGVLVKGGGAVEYGVSRYGTLVFVPGGTAYRLMLLDRLGQERLIAANTEFLNHPRFSPDGTRIAIASLNGDIAILDLERGTFTQMTFDGSNLYPEWTPDGRRIAFASARGGDYDLYWTPADGSGRPEPLLEAELDQYEISWFPDGRAFAFRQNGSETARDIWMAELGGSSDPRPLIATPADERMPRISPDGRWLAYVSNESGPDEVYVRPLPDLGAKWLVSSGGGSEPAWGPDGRELFYRRGGDLVILAVETSPAFRVSSDSVVRASDYLADANHPHYDVAPDGEHFIMVARPEQEAMVVVLNWLEEIGSR